LASAARLASWPSGTLLRSVIKQGGGPLSMDLVSHSTSFLP
jgi:hypothetical protein